METMNYDKISKNKHSALLIGTCAFVVLGSGLVTYSLMNEEEPTILGYNPLVNIEVEQTSPDVSMYTSKVVSLTPTTDSTSKYSASISLPKVYINDEELEDFNADLKANYLKIYNTLKEDGADTLENAFLYKISYTSNEVLLDDLKLLSIVVNETITSGGTDTFSNKYFGYTIDLVTKQVLTQNEVAPLVLGYSYRNKIKEQIKDYFISKGFVSETKYNYSLTGLEEFYVKDGKFHIVFNPSQAYNTSKSIIDIVINK